MKNLKLNQTAFAGTEILTKAQLKNVMGGVQSDMAYCTYVLTNGGLHTEDGLVNNPSGSGYATAKEYAEAFCASDPNCVSVSC